MTLALVGTEAHVCPNANYRALATAPSKLVSSLSEADSLVTQVGIQGVVLWFALMCWTMPRMRALSCSTVSVKGCPGCVAVSWRRIQDTLEWVPWAHYSQ